jgi:hypothetical protein
MVYFVRTVLRSGTPARNATSYETAEAAMQVAGAELKKGYAIDAWIEDRAGDTVADLATIKRHCGIG